MTVKNLDKYQHLGVGSVIALLGALVAPPVGIFVCMLAAYVKEFLDKKDPAHHTYDGWDAFATGVGSLVGVSIIHALVSLGFWSYLI